MHKLSSWTTPNALNHSIWHPNSSFINLKLKLKISESNNTEASNSTEPGFEHQELVEERIGLEKKAQTLKSLVKV